MRWPVLIGCLVSSAASIAHADSLRGTAQPPFDGKKWVERIRSVVAREGWTIRDRGQDIIVERNEPTPTITVYPNPSVEIEKQPAPKPAPADVYREKVRYVLRFAPRMTLDEYERLARINAASNAEIERLQNATKLMHKGAIESIAASTPEEKQRLRQFKEAVAKLPRHDLPDLYTTDHSVRLFVSWGRGYGTHLTDRLVAEECENVEEKLLRYFGVYDPKAASSSGNLGRYEPDSK